MVDGAMGFVGPADVHVCRLEFVWLELGTLLLLCKGVSSTDWRLADQALSRLRRHADRATLLRGHDLTGI